MIELNYARFTQLQQNEADEETLNKFRIVHISPWEVVNVQTNSVTYVSQDDPEDIHTRRITRGKKLKRHRDTYSSRFTSIDEFSLENLH